MARITLRFRAVDKAGFDAVRDGRKTIETRAATVRYQKVQPGDVLIFTCGDERIEKEVQVVAHHDSIEALFASVPLTQVFPDLQTSEQAQSIYYGYPGYREKIARHGILAWTLE